MKKKELIISAINNILGTNFKPEEIHDGTSLIDDLLFDSITLVQLIVELEEVFNVSLDDIEDFTSLETYKKLSLFIDEKVDANSYDAGE